MREILRTANILSLLSLRPHLRSNQFRIFNWPTATLTLSLSCLFILLAVSGKNFDYFLCRFLFMKKLNGSLSGCTFDKTPDGN